MVFLDCRSWAPHWPTHAHEKMEAGVIGSLLRLLGIKQSQTKHIKHAKSLFLSTKRFPNFLSVEGFKLAYRSRMAPEAMVLKYHWYLSTIHAVCSFETEGTVTQRY